MTSRLVHRAVVLSLGLVAVACQRQEPRPAVAAAAPRMTTPLSYDVVAGSVPVKAEGSGELEAVVEGTALPLGATRQASWDTTQVKDGLATVSLRRRGGAPLAAVPVVVLNNGSEVFFKTGLASDTIDVAPAGYQEKHMRYHWDMPAGVKTVLAVLTWPEPGFELELALGKGTCPHHGTKLADRTSSTSPLALRFEAPPSAQIGAGEQWFAHVRLVNPQQVSGKKTTFSVRAFLLR